MKTKISIVNKKGEFIISNNKSENCTDNLKIGDCLYFDFKFLAPKARVNLKNTFGEKIGQIIIDNHYSFREKYGAYKYKIVSKYACIEVDIDDITCESSEVLNIEYTVKRVVTISDIYYKFKNKIQWK